MSFIEGVRQAGVKSGPLNWEHVSHKHLGCGGLRKGGNILRVTETTYYYLHQGGYVLFVYLFGSKITRKWNEQIFHRTKTDIFECVQVGVWFPVGSYFIVVEPKLCHPLFHALPREPRATVGLQICEYQQVWTGLKGQQYKREQGQAEL